MRGKGEGSIYKRKDGRHEAAISSPTGRVYVTRRAKESYEAFSARVEKEKRRAKSGHSRDTLKEFLAQWLAAVKPSLRPKSFDSYEDTVNIYLVPTIGEVPLAKLSPSHVQKAMKHAADLKRSPRTVAYVRSILRRALHVAQRWGLVDRNVAALVDPPRVEKREFDLPEAEAWNDFLAAVEGHDYEALFLILALLGLRRGEALALSWSDLEGSSLRVVRALQRVTGQGLVVAPVKTSTSRRTLPLPSIIADALTRWRVRQLEWRIAAGERWNQNDFMFTNRIGAPVSPEMLRKMAGKVWPHRVHDFRHVAASHLLAEGAPLEVVSDLLGHSSIRVTKDVYGHIPQRVLDATATKLQEIGTRKTQR